MKYEVYKQDDIVNNEKVIRYHTERKSVAFDFMQVKNKLANKNIWRVAKCINDRIIIDIDITDIVNLKYIIEKYEEILDIEFKAIKTNSGFHLISQKKYENLEEWIYDECRILYTLLSKEDTYKYIQLVKDFYKIQTIKERKKGIKKDDFLNELSDEFKKSGLYMGYGTFDILFSINVLFRGYHCIRISKKSIDDKPYEVKYD